MGDRGIQGRRITELLELVYKSQDFLQGPTDWLSKHSEKATRGDWKGRFWYERRTRRLFPEGERPCSGSYAGAPSTMSVCLVNKSSSGTPHLMQDLQQDIHGCASTKIIKRGMLPLKWVILLVFYHSTRVPLNSERVTPSSYVIYACWLVKKSSCIHQTYGEFRDISNNHPQIFGYLRVLGDVRALILLNFKETSMSFSIQDVEDLDAYTLVLSNYDGMNLDDGKLQGADIVLRGYEGRVYLKKWREPIRIFQAILIPGFKAI